MYRRSCSFASRQLRVIVVFVLVGCVCYLSQHDYLPVADSGSEKLHKYSAKVCTQCYAVHLDSAVLRQLFASCRVRQEKYASPRSHA